MIKEMGEMEVYLKRIRQKMFIFQLYNHIMKLNQAKIMTNNQACKEAILWLKQEEIQHLELGPILIAPSFQTIWNKALISHQCKQRIDLEVKFRNLH
jgi:hypothetical protein